MLHISFCTWLYSTMMKIFLKGGWVGFNSVILKNRGFLTADLGQINDFKPQFFSSIKNGNSILKSQGC